MVLIRTPEALYMYGISCCLIADQENLDCDFEDEESSQTCLKANLTAQDQWVLETEEDRDLNTVCEYL